MYMGIQQYDEKKIKRKQIEKQTLINVRMEKNHTNAVTLVGLICAKLVNELVAPVWKLFEFSAKSEEPGISSSIRSKVVRI